jgi:FtsP/CotA-like multicopper oxidase with cupredoxin domain
VSGLSRRTLFVAGAAGFAAAAVGGTGLAFGWGQPSTGTMGASSAAQMVEPAVLRSSGGLLAATLVAAPTHTTVAGISIHAMTYNGSLPGPTLRVHAGDRIRLSLRNELPDPTNLHTHGLHVSPKGNGDNPLVRVDPGGSFDYEYVLPVTHPPGVYWYHPHHHGMAADQVFAGLYGAIIVEDAVPIPVARERVLVVSDITVDAAGTIASASAMDRMAGREGTIMLLNGQVTPTLTGRPGERERWRIVNACTSRYLRLRLDGQTMQLLGMDSGRFAEPQTVDEVDLAPGNRADLFVTLTSGSSTLRALPVDRGSVGMMGSTWASSAFDLATLRVSGAQTSAAPRVPAQPQPRDLRTARIDGTRTITLSMGMGSAMGMGQMTFAIDGKSFDPSRIDTAVQFGSVEEWTLRNTSGMDHPFHLHVWPMQVIAQNGVSVPVETWLDVVSVPAGGETRVRIAFEDFDGTAVYHCHILDHEDAGMMALISVT